LEKLCKKHNFDLVTESIEEETTITQYTKKTHS